jgi:hypothetical protein
LVITAANGRQSIDTVTVTIGGKPPVHVAASGSIQSAIDAAAPGDLIIVDPTCTASTGTVACSAPPSTAVPHSQAAHNELLLMWKPVRLQGVGAASSIINANTHPAGKLDPWRQHVNCLFGLNLNGTPISTGNPYDPTGTVACPASGWNYFVETPDNAQVDPLPAEAVLGWDASLNGNLAQLLQEPSLMGALEGAGITVLAKGVDFPVRSGGFAAPGLTEGSFPTGTTLLTGSNVSSSTGSYATGDANASCHTRRATTNPFPSNFSCNPSSIDGLGITDSSQGGGAIFVHAWAHNLQIANNRLYSNAGTLSGGINVGQGEFAPQQIQGSADNVVPGSCVTFGVANGAQLPYCANLNVNIHHNDISLNSSTGDELFSATPAGAGGVSICSGADYYKFNYNWVCGNLSSGDGGGVGHLGVSYNGDIEHNSILFNQSLNPTIPANGGGLLVMGTPDIAPPCSDPTDKDCVSAPNTVLPSDGIGPNLVINANLIMGNAAEAGSGGGLRLQNVNGADVLAFPTTPSQWYSPTVTNNIIADNVAGWDGAGISLVDALNVNIINNTIVSNSTTASAGILFTTIGYPLASSEGNNCTNASATQSCPQVSGLVSIENSAVLQANLPATVTCPANHYAPGTSASNGTCRKYSYPLLTNDVFWQNSAYYIGVGALSNQFQQNVVSLYNAFTTTLAPQQPQADATTAHGNGVTITGGTGACAAASYWDVGVRGDLGPADHTGSGITLNPTYSVLTPGSTGYSGTNITSNPTFASQYCDGSRTPPEFGASGWAVPPGISDATVPNPIFNLTPVATVDEGNNWINMRWGPLSLLNPVTNTQLGNYVLAVNSPAIDYVPTSEPNYNLVPRTDFFGNPRPDPARRNAFDVGAVEYQGVDTTGVATVAGGPLAFGSVGVGTTSAAQALTLDNTGGANLTGITVAVTAPFSRPGGAAGGTCGVTLAAGTSCTINVVFSPTAVQAYTGTATITASVTVNGSPVQLSGTGVVPSASVSPSPLAFGNWAAGTTSGTLNLTVTNTGVTALAGGAFTFGGGTPQPFSRVTSGTFPAGAPNCGTTLAAGASCTIKVQFAPATAVAYNRTLTVAFTGATVTPTPVQLTGTGVATRATVSVTPNPLTITLATGVNTGTGTVTLTNTAGAGGSQVTVTSDAVTGGGFFTYNFTKVTGADTCTGATLAPGASCTVGVRFTNVTSPRGANRAGTITFTDSGAGSPQSGSLIGHANP